MTQYRRKIKSQKKLFVGGVHFGCFRFELEKCTYVWHIKGKHLFIPSLHNNIKLTNRKAKEWIRFAKKMEWIKK